MKNTHEKIITNKEKYLTKAESVKIATIIEAVYKIKTEPFCENIASGSVNC